MSDPINQLYVLIGILILTAIVWALCAFASYANYRAFQQRADLWWMTAFGLLGLARVGLSWEAWGWVQNLDLMGQSLQSVVESTTAARLRYAVLELLAAFVVLYLFRIRRPEI